MVRSSGVQSFQCSQWSQQHQPQHHEDALLISEAEKFLGLKLAFKADRIQIHVANQMELVAKAMIVGPQQHVLGPPGTANENRLAIHPKEATTIRCEFRSDFSNSEVDALFIRLDSLLCKADREVLKVRVAHLVRPPWLRVLHMQRGHLFRRQHYSSVFMRRKLHRLLEMNPGRCP